MIARLGSEDPMGHGIAVEVAKRRANHVAKRACGGPAGWRKVGCRGRLGGESVHSGVRLESLARDA